MKNYLPLKYNYNLQQIQAYLDKDETDKKATVLNKWVFPNEMDAYQSLTGRSQKISGVHIHVAYLCL